MEMQSGGGNVCKCPHHSILPLLVIVFGVLFLGGSLGWWDSSVVNIGWPIVVILAGLMKLMGKECKCCGKPEHTM